MPLSVFNLIEIGKAMLPFWHFFECIYLQYGKTLPSFLKRSKEDGRKLAELLVNTQLTERIY